ncbi:hypothetical protein [Pontibacillus marinus]|uniref:Uncharacterized protein n=1 Tax=Pontibacillus marinus BH030004 = DSM 16465 TaxID=1385511 RepID=A0A0A5G5N5_9BACI|nr:hypothetical protein [Pontibacillus marinus]KGX86405.1 hypothetical protein N783_12205 [Pontibacillus marinus BH030004 = DSM 16465]
MAADSGLDHNEDLDQEPKTSSKGTYFSLGVLAAVILVTYIILYGLYMFRI